MSFVKTFLRAGLFFGIFMAIYLSLSDDWRRGIPLGLLSGVFFGLIMASFVQYQSRKFTKNRPLLSGEKLIKEGPANHFLKGEGVGGWIYLTDSRLFFVSHKLNVQSHELVLPFDEIIIAENSRTLGILSNKLNLTLKNGQVEKFVVNDAKSWVKELQEHI